MTDLSIPQSPGVYRIQNIINGRFYIGSTKNLRQRWQQHKTYLRAGHHHNPHLQSAWNKYGADSFRFCVIEIVADLEALSQREQFWLGEFDSTHNPNCYNIRESASSNLGYKHSSETRQRMSELQRVVCATPERKRISGENLRQYNLQQKGIPKSRSHREKIAASNMGRIVDETTRLKLSAAHKGKPNLKLRGRKKSEEHRRNLSLAHGGDGLLKHERVHLPAIRPKGANHHRSRPVIQLSLDGIILRRYVSVTSAAEETKIKREAISNCLNHRSKVAGGFIWRYEIADLSR